jgi:hypothetical protein
MPFVLDECSTGVRWIWYNLSRGEQAGEVPRTAQKAIEWQRAPPLPHREHESLNIVVGGEHLKFRSNVQQIPAVAEWTSPSNT